MDKKKPYSLISSDAVWILLTLLNSDLDQEFSAGRLREEPLIKVAVPDPATILIWIWHNYKRPKGIHD